MVNVEKKTNKRVLLQILFEFHACAHRNFTGLIRLLNRESAFSETQLWNHQILKECQERVRLALCIHGLSSSDLDVFSFHLCDFHCACVVFPLHQYRSRLDRAHLWRRC